MGDQATRLPPIPVTVIGGYLGSGKTTLVNHLLRAADGLRLAIMVNEFGDLPIDEDLIEAQGDDMIALAGGCVCCSYGDDLMAAMQQMVAMENRPDHIVLEASGVALPGSIAGSLSLLPDIVDDGIVVLADAENVRKLANDKYMYDTVLRQLSDADLLILNKIDLIGEALKDEVQNWLKDTAPEAIFLESEHSVVDPALVLQSFVGRPRGAYLMQTHRNPMKSKLVAPPDDADISSWVTKLAKNDGVVRAKGFVQDGKVIKTLQLVGQRWTLSAAPPERKVGVVVIGPDLSGVEELA